MTIPKEFRASMNWLHTWLGISLGGILFTIFFMGTLTVFHMEINRWMMPELRIDPDVDAPLDPIMLPKLRDVALQDKASIFVHRANEREPLLRVQSISAGARSEIWVHPESGDEVDRTDTLGATGFFYPFHYRLHISWRGLGYWIVGLAAMAMLVLIASGLFIHRKIFQDFFTFRPQKKTRRSVLDLHNLTAVVALPFHILFPFSGILIFALLYFPNSVTSAHDGDVLAYIEENTGFYTPAFIGEPASLPSSLDAFVEQAEAIWTRRDGKPARADSARIANIGDAGSEVLVQHVFPKRGVAMTQGAVSFSAADGRLVQDFAPLPVQNTSAWIEGAHFMKFESWLVRWLFFFGGLSGSVMIGSGLVFWMQARLRQTTEPSSVRVIRALTIGTTTGLVLASIFFLLANRLLAPDAVGFGLGRAGLEVAGFFAVWIITFVHAGVRNRRAWEDQSLAIAGAALMAVALNWVTTGDHFIAAAMPGKWSVFGVDLVLIVTSALSVWVALGLRRRSLGNHSAARRKLQDDLTAAPVK